MSDPEIHVIGSGGLAKEVIAALRASDYAVTCAFDDDLSRWNDEVLGVPVKGPQADAAQGDAQAVLALPGPTRRKSAAQSLELEWLTVVHPHSWVAPTASLGPGTVVLAGAVIQSDTKLAGHVVVEAGAVIGNDCQLEDFVTVAAGCTLEGAVWIGEGSRLGAGCVVLEGRRIGSGCVVRAGSVVTADVPDGATVGGNPAAPAKDVVITSADLKPEAKPKPSGVDSTVNPHKTIGDI